MNKILGIIELYGRNMKHIKQFIRAMHDAKQLALNI